jgi:hypothetical protein
MLRSLKGSLFNKIDISILMACRNNHSQFKDALNSLSTLCSNKSKVEIILKVDLDDQIKFYRSKLNESGFPFKILEYDKMDGYNDLHVFYNDLAAISSGKLLWLSTDDVIVESANWDSIIIKEYEEELAKRKEITDNIFIINFKNNSDIFPPQRAPMVTREFYKKLGYLSPYRAWDKYLNIMASMSNRRLYVNNLKLRPSHIEHKRRGGLSHSETHIIGNRELSGYIERDIKNKLNLEVFTENE